MTAFIRPSKRTAAKNRAKRSNYAAVCREVDARDGDRCRVCGCLTLRGRHHHHLIFRSRGGKDVPSNLIVVCAWCHDDIHQQRMRVSGTATNLSVWFRPTQGWDGLNSAMSKSTATVTKGTL
jgi:5-methylcytosine-specific restriction endonuclease McrA